MKNFYIQITVPEEADQEIGLAALNELKEKMIEVVTVVDANVSLEMRQW